MYSVITILCNTFLFPTVLSSDSSGILNMKCMTLACIALSVCVTWVVQGHHNLLRLIITLGLTSFNPDYQRDETQRTGERVRERHTAAMISCCVRVSHTYPRGVKWMRVRYQLDKCEVTRHVTFLYTHCHGLHKPSRFAESPTHLRVLYTTQLMTRKASPVVLHCMSTEITQKVHKSQAWLIHS